MSFVIANPTVEDAAVLARLKDMADDGLPRLIWERDKRPGETLWDAAARSFASSASRANARLAVARGQAIGLALSYEMTPPTPPAFPELAPLAELVSRVVGTWYLDALAVVPQARGRGVAQALIADTLARAGDRDMALIVLEHNTAAQTLYHRNGFVELARLPLTPKHWPIPPQQAILMIRRRHLFA